MHNFIISEEAVSKLNAIKASNALQNAMKIEVEGGGCNGMRYKLELVDKAAYAKQYVVHHTFEQNGAEVLIDDISMPFLQDSRLEYIKKLGQEHFEIKNPNAATSCGCKESFSLKM